MYSKTNQLTLQINDTKVLEHTFPQPFEFDMFSIVNGWLDQNYSDKVEVNPKTQKSSKIAMDTFIVPFELIPLVLIRARKRV